MRFLAILLVALVGCSPAVAETPTPTPTPTPQVVYVDVPGSTHDLSVWSGPYTFSIGGYTTMGMADAFTTHIRFRATKPVRVRIMTFNEFVKYAAGASVGTAYPPSIDFDLVFHDAEGCAGYVLVLEAEADTTIYPNVTVNYAPSKTPTGVCAN